MISPGVFGKIKCGCEKGDKHARGTRRPCNATTVALYMWLATAGNRRVGEARSLTVVVAAGSVVVVDGVEPGTTSVTLVVDAGMPIVVVEVDVTTVLVVRVDVRAGIVYSQLDSSRWITGAGSEPTTSPRGCESIPRCSAWPGGFSST